MDLFDRTLSASLTFIALCFSLAIAWAVLETFTTMHLAVGGSRAAVLWAIVAVGVTGAIIRWRRLSGAADAGMGRAAPQAGRRRGVLAQNPSAEVNSIFHGTEHPTAPLAHRREPQERSEIDMALAADVAWVRAQPDPTLWHQATMAALAYRGDEHGFVEWVLAQSETDRATVGWIFLWAEGSRYLRDGMTGALSHVSGDHMSTLLRAVCNRSEADGFRNDGVGLDPEFEPERQACLTLIDEGGVTADVIAPVTLLAGPFNAPARDDRHILDDGIIYLRHDENAPRGTGRDVVPQAARSGGSAGAPSHGSSRSSSDRNPSAAMGDRGSTAVPDEDAAGSLRAGAEATMSDVVWISTAPRDASNMRPLRNDVVDRGPETFEPILDRVRTGEPLLDGDFPERIYGAPDARESAYNLPDLFKANGFWVVSSAARDVLDALDLGQGKMRPVEVLKNDKQTPVGGAWFCISFGNRKQALLPAESRRMRLGYIKDGRKGWFPAGGIQDDDVAVSPRALAGPDIWIDPDVGDCIFLSDRAAKALKKAKAAKGFLLSRCRVVED